LLFIRLCQNVELLDKDSERLRHLLRWRDLEGVFWKWMESVVDAKQASASSVGDGGDDVSGLDDGVGGDVGNVNMLGVYGAARLTESHHSLQQAILKYESIVEHLERVCEEKVHHEYSLLFILCCSFVFVVIIVIVIVVTANLNTGFPRLLEILESPGFFS